MTTSAFPSTNWVKLPPGRLMDGNNFRFARHPLLNECYGLISTSIVPSRAHICPVCGLRKLDGTPLQRSQLVAGFVFPIKYADFRPASTHWAYGHRQHLVIRRKLDLLSVRELAIDLVGHFQGERVHSAY